MTRQWGILWLLIAYRTAITGVLWLAYRRHRPVISGVLWLAYWRQRMGRTP
jgi:hypothetical protein